MKCSACNVTGGSCTRDAVLKGFCNVHFVKWQEGVALVLRADLWIDDNGLRRL